MSNSNIAAISGIITMRSHAYLNNLDLSEDTWLWVLVALIAVTSLIVFIESIVALAKEK